MPFTVTMIVAATIVFILIAITFSVLFFFARLGLETLRDERIA